MAEKLIRESDVIKLIDEWLDNYPLPRHVEKGLQSHEELLAYIADAPTIEAKPIVHAHWVTDFDFDPEEEQELYFYFCSKCKNELFGEMEDFKYCPYCGAQMDERENDNATY